MFNQYTISSLIILNNYKCIKYLIFLNRHKERIRQKRCEISCRNIGLFLGVAVGSVVGCIALYSFYNTLQPHTVDVEICEGRGSGYNAISGTSFCITTTETVKPAEEWFGPLGLAFSIISLSALAVFGRVFVGAAGSCLGKGIDKVNEPLAEALDRREKRIIGENIKFFCEKHGKDRDTNAQIHIEPIIMGYTG